MRALQDLENGQTPLRLKVIYSEFYLPDFLLSKIIELCIEGLLFALLLFSTYNLTDKATKMPWHSPILQV